ncbi:MAG: hypothetical protein KatS3mg027_2265 [Bacteroidia bacterium]|nr:MAG: hypothetical protein KatS3mg027_2265 [Bacteroidia bacterium]
MLHHLITNNQKDIAAEAEDVVVMFDFNKMNKIQIPDELRKSIEKVESK